MREFKSIGAMVAHLALMEAAALVEMHRSLEKCAVKIEKTAQAEIGIYQPEVGYFAEWDALAESTLAFHNSFGVGDTPLLLTGELYASIGHETIGLEACIGSTSDIMIYQELGTDKIPPRAVLGPAAIHNVEFIRKELGTAVVNGLLYGSNESRVLLNE